MTAVALLDGLLHHTVTVVTSGDSNRMKEARTGGGRGKYPPLGRLQAFVDRPPAPEYFHTAIDSRGACRDPRSRPEDK